MIKVLIGSVAAAVAMFVLGFIFFATPLGGIALGTVGDNEAAAIQSVLAANLDPESARTVAVPSGEGSVQQRMYIDGPIATIHYNPNGFAVSDPGVMLGGFIHMLISALLLGAALYTIAGHARLFSQRLAIVALFGIAASFFMHLGNPIWWHEDWTYHIYVFIADAISFIAGGAIIAKWFLPSNVRTEDTFGAEA